jgi:hypothetical protein
LLCSIWCFGLLPTFSVNFYSLVICLMYKYVLWGPLMVAQC